MACDLHGEQKVIGGTDAAKVRARTVNALNALTGRPQVDVSRAGAKGSASAEQ